MPTIFDIFGYKIYFCSNEGNEPVHVHVNKGDPSPNATKIWVPASGMPVLEHNNSGIPKRDLLRIMKYIAANRADIYLEWHRFFER